MKITRSEVEHVAQLARLQFDDEQLELFVNQLNAILDYFDKLQDLDTRDCEPTSHVVPINNAFRNDAEEGFSDKELLLKNAPSEENNCFKVPKIIE
jgi:aspartyl-tRNA(Asn)/glutamyl-tRNA(Gln) amidotransferase subunit C